MCVDVIPYSSFLTNNIYAKSESVFSCVYLERPALGVCRKGCPNRVTQVENTIITSHNASLTTANVNGSKRVASRIPRATKLTNTFYIWSYFRGL